MMSKPTTMGGARPVQPQQPQQPPKTQPARPGYSHRWRPVFEWQWRAGGFALGLVGLWDPDPALLIGLGFCTIGVERRRIWTPM